MFRAILLALILLLGIKCYSQRVFVADSITKTHLAFVAVKYDKGGLYSNEVGWFYLDAIKGDTIELSLLGYQTKQLQTDNVKDTIFLANKPTLLDEITIKESKGNNQIIYKQPKKTNYYGSTVLNSKSELLLILIPNSPHKSTYIEDILFFFNKKIEIQKDTKEALKKVDGVIRINLYNVDNEKPSQQIYASQPIKISSFKKDEMVLNLSDEFINIPEEGICIGIEMIGYYDDAYIEVSGESYVRPMLTPQKYEHFKAITYKRYSFPIDDDNNNLILMSDYLKRLGVVEPKHFDRNLAIGLTLSESSD